MGPLAVPRLRFAAAGPARPQRGTPARCPRPAEAMSLHPRGGGEDPPPTDWKVRAGQSPSGLTDEGEQGSRGQGGWGQAAPWAEEIWRRSVRAPSGQSGGWKRWPRPSAVCEGGEQRGSARRSGLLGRMRRRVARVALDAQPERRLRAHGAKKESLHAVDKARDRGDEQALKVAEPEGHPKPPPRKWNKWALGAQPERPLRARGAKKENPAQSGREAEGAGGQERNGREWDRT
jgi:hypothetical protein